MQHSMLKEVTSASQHWTVRVRVTRFNETHSLDDPPRPILIDLVLIDEEGTMMEGQIPEKRIPHFKTVLHEDSVYYLTSFYVCGARSQYRPAEHEYMIRFTPHTKVQEISTTLPNFPRYACKIATYQVLRSRATSRDYCSDAIGVFTGCSQVRQQNTRRGVKPLREIYITDGREDAVVALWDQHAAQFDADYFIQMAQRGPLILLFVGVTCQLYNDKISLQSSTCCKWYANPELPEVTTLRNSCSGNAIAPTIAGAGPPETDPEHITVSELAKMDNPHVIYGNRYITDVKISSLVPNRPWWYPACQLCHKTSIQEGDVAVCRNKKCSGSKSEPRYRLAMIAVDPAASQSDAECPQIELVVFGPKAQELIGTSVETLIAADTTDGSFLPSQITSLYGKCFQMHISVSPYSMQSENVIFQIDAVLGTVSSTPPVPRSGSHGASPDASSAQVGSRKDDSGTSTNIAAEATETKSTPSAPNLTPQQAAISASKSTPEDPKILKRSSDATKTGSKAGTADRVVRRKLELSNEST